MAINFDSFLLQNPWRKGRYSFPEYIERSIFNDVRKWLPKEQIIIISGARQTGKSTLMYQIIKTLLEKYDPRDILYFNFDDESLQNSVHEPSEFINFINQQSSGKTFVFLDEVQRIDNPGLFLKYIYDLHLPIKMIVSGSSSLEIHSKTVEHLTGRKKFFYLFPFSFKEYLSFRAPHLYTELQAIDRVDIEAIFQKDKFINSSITELLHEFLLYGGYPAVVKEKIPLSP